VRERPKSPRVGDDDQRTDFLDTNDDATMRSSTRAQSDEATDDDASDDPTRRPRATRPVLETARPERARSDDLLDDAECTTQA
jgi:hypothetical protein